MMGLKFILEKSFDLVSKLFRNQENFENAQKNEVLMNRTAYIEENRIKEEFRRVFELKRIKMKNEMEGKEEKMKIDRDALT